jgi:hypothetical protein
MSDLLVICAAGKVVCRVWAGDCAQGGAEHSSVRGAVKAEVECIRGNTTGCYIVRKRLPMEPGGRIEVAKLIECAATVRTAI